ncbi:MAG: hypothetical protein ACOX81_02755 [Candidatus Heteroscillospira sp.]|jgi:transcription elongation factor Elf1
MRKLNCLRCGAEMNHISDKTFQLGQTGWFLGDLPNLLAGGMRMSIYACPDCGKLEFYAADEVTCADGIQQVKCPNCGKTHDMDYPKCPFCKYDYTNR